MRIMIWFLLLLCTSTAVFCQSTAGDPGLPFTITIRPVTQIVKSAADVSITIRLTNVSSHTISGSSSYFEGVDASYRQEICDSKGTLPKRERSGTHLRFAGHWTRRSLQPGQSADSVSGISPEYDINHPGQYTIQLLRPVSDDPKDGVVKSNLITVKVAP